MRSTVTDRNYIQFQHITIGIYHQYNDCGNPVQSDSFQKAKKFKNDQSPAKFNLTARKHGTKKETKNNL